MMKCLKYLFYFWLVLATIFNIKAENPQQMLIDSLHLVLENQVGTEHIQTLLLIADVFSESSNTSAVKYANDALKLSISSSDKLNMANSYMRLATYSYVGENYDKSLNYSNKALKYYNQLGTLDCLSAVYLDMATVYSRLGQLDSAQYFSEVSLEQAYQIYDTLNQVKSLRSIGNVYYKQGQADLALKHFHQALALSKHSSLCCSEQSMLYNNLGVLFSDWQEFDKSLAYYRKALEIADSLGSVEESSRLYNNMGTIYWYKENNDSALMYYLKSLDYREKTGDKNGKAYVLNNLGMYYGSVEKYEKSLDYFQQSFVVFEELFNRMGTTMTLYNIGSVYQELKEFDLAAKYFQESLNISQAQGFGDYLIANYQALNEVFSENKKWDKAYFALLGYNRLNDSIRKVQNIDLIRNIEVKFEREMNQADISILQNEMEATKVDKLQTRIFIAGAVVILILVIGLAYLIIWQIRSRTNFEHSKLTPALLRYQLNPQFINSSLSGIKELIGKNRVKESGLFLSGFARLIRVFIETSTNNAIVLDKEIEAYHSFFKLHQLRYEHELKFDIDVAGHVETEILAIPPLILFPIFAHAIDFHLSLGEVRIKIEIDTDENYLQMKGEIYLPLFKDENLADHQDMKNSLVEVKERIRLLNKTLKDKMSFVYRENIVDEGAKKHQYMELYIPVRPM
ncbi:MULTISPECIES: tetratricopeptide repeat protein [unclassified Lentimicrobium]|uniref:tetratricopeptide repeat protein n=1 Tax=unclassified Lentimicrobium TaxID=2677434 RepID=UPI0015536F90|nr:MULTISPECIES: tetratricopeptide repeat protein [unclassified Lentimicrobium]NPD46962.1 tetratricopeptide repeat protein [Lentimicrobium sp. S6]NPD84728.1 tetratricopeptide repeat protein [Lentimicrobium sp. L6]